MNKVSYTYCIIKYVPDPAAGEMLNIGVILCAPRNNFLGMHVELRYQRLSDAFADFDGEDYRRAIHQLERALYYLNNKPSGTLFALQEPVIDAQQLSALLIPDAGLSLQLGPMLAGITENPQAELKYIFNRMVASQYNRKHGETRSDVEVWHNYLHPLRQRKINIYLQPVRLSTDAYDLKFDHALKNEQWSVLHPVSFDYAKAENLQSKATRVLGTTAALKGDPRLNKMFILLGLPRSPEHRAAYIKAKNLLHKIPIKHEIFEEEEAEAFAEEIASYVRTHAVEEAPHMRELNADDVLDE